MLTTSSSTTLHLLQSLSHGFFAKIAASYYLCKFLTAIEIEFLTASLSGATIVLYASAFPVWCFSPAPAIFDNLAGLAPYALSPAPLGISPTLADFP